MIALLFGMLDLFTILNNPLAHFQKDFYIPTSEEAKEAREAYETLRREEEPDPVEDAISDQDFNEHLKALAYEMAEDGDISEEDLADLLEDMDMDDETEDQE